LSFGYDGDGNRTQVADSFGGTQYSSYDSSDMLTNAQFSQGANSILQIGQAYNADKQVTEQLRYGPSNPPVGVANTTYTRDNAGRVTSILDTNPTGTTTLASYSLAYDAAGNLSKQIDHGATTTYTYDNAEQLTGDSSEAFSYDAGGNRSTYTFNSSYKNQLTYDGTWSYSYDGEGNEISKYKTGETWTYGYDNKNQMISARDTVSGTVATTAIYKYDALGNRIETDVTQSGATTTTRFAYDGWNPAKGAGTGNSNYDVWAEMDGSSSLTTRYLRGDVVDQVFARMAYSGGVYTSYWYLTDQQGTIRDVIDNTDTVVDTINYGAFGNITSETGSNTAARGRYGFDSYMWDAETNLDRSGRRIYDPATARWKQEDPLGLQPGPNPYEYVNNRPTVETDPSGMDSVSVSDNVVNWTPIPGPTNDQPFRIGTISNGVVQLNQAFGGNRVSLNSLTAIAESITEPHDNIPQSEVALLISRVPDAGPTSAQGSVAISMYAAPARCISCHNPVIMGGGSISDLPRSFQVGAMMWTRTDNVTDCDRVIRETRAVAELTGFVARVEYQVLADAAMSLRAVVTGEAGTALGERAVAVVERDSGRGITGNMGDWLRALWNMGNDLLGVYAMAEGSEGANIATGQPLSGTERVTRAAGGLGGYLSLTTAMGSRLLRAAEAAAADVAAARVGAVEIANSAPTTTLAEELQSLRQAQGQGGMVGVARTDLPGLEGTTFRGASPRAGGPIEPGGSITSPNPNSLFRLHAEQDLVNQIDRTIQGARLTPEQMVGKTVNMLIEERVCNICRQGLGGTEVPPGVLKQLSDKYPNITFVVRNQTTSEVLRFRGGKFVD